MGKPVGEAAGEVHNSALTAEYYATHGPGIREFTNTRAYWVAPA